MSGLLSIAGWILVLGQTVAGEPPIGPSLADLAAAVEQLGAAKYELRQQATERIWAAGEAAIPALELGIVSKNPEIRARAAYVLENLRQGITIDTPREILREVQRYREGDVDEKRLALRNLETSLRPRIVLGLIRDEPNTRLRDEWFRTLERSIRFAILGGADREVELTLRQAATQDEWMRHWAAYLADCGRIDEELVREAGIAEPERTSEQAQRMAYLWRAKGDLSEARRYAEQATILRNSARQRGETSGSGSPPLQSDDGSTDLAWELTLELRDWSSAAREMQSRLDASPETLTTDPEFLALAAAYHRLSHDVAGSDRFAAMLRAVADEAALALPDLDPRRQDVRKSNLDRQWEAGKALLLNGRHEDAIYVLRRNHAPFAFEVLAHQQRYREAFEVAGVPYPQGFDSQWFDAVVIETAAADDTGRQKFGMAMHALRHLYFLGQRDQVRQWLAAMVAGVAKDSGTVRRRMVCETAVKLGFRELARESGAVILEREGSPSALSILYPERHNLATVWFDYYREHLMSESLVQSLARIDRCLRYGGDPFEPQEFARLVADAETKLGRLAEPKRAESLHGLAESCLLHGERDQAWRLFEKAAAYSAADALRLGDLHAAAQQWQSASEWYRRAWEFDKLKPLPGFLHAQALVQAGQREEGEQLAKRILRLVLGSGDERRELAAGLKERGYRQDSLQQFELLLRTGEPGGQDVVEAAKQIGNLVYLQDELRAADCWDAMVLRCLLSKWVFVDSSGYVQIPFLVHKTRAKGLARSGQKNEALEEIAMATRVSPLNLELPEELIPVLREAAWHVAAEELFFDSYATIKELSEAFPACATMHNNLAWLVARNGRELEQALQHAEQALVLDPENPSYLDTLGEVHFRRGQLVKAIQCAERCLQIDARNAHYQQQLARYRAASGDGPQR